MLLNDFDLVLVLSKYDTKVELVHFFGITKKNNLDYREKKSARLKHFCSHFSINLSNLYFVLYLC